MPFNKSIFGKILLLCAIRALWHTLVKSKKKKKPKLWDSDLKKKKPNLWAWNWPHQPLSVVRSFTLWDTKKKKKIPHIVSLHHFDSFHFQSQLSFYFYFFYFFLFPSFQLRIELKWLFESSRLETSGIV